MSFLLKHPICSLFRLLYTLLLLCALPRLWYELTNWWNGMPDAFAVVVSHRPLAEQAEASEFILLHSIVLLASVAIPAAFTLFAWVMTSPMMFEASVPFPLPPRPPKPILPGHRNPPPPPLRQL